MKKFITNRKRLMTLIVLVTLVIALPVVLYLVQRQQIFKPKASTDISSFLNISSDEAGVERINCGLFGNNFTSCYTERSGAYIRFNEETLNELLNTLPD